MTRMPRCQKRFFPIETPLAAATRPRTLPVAPVPPKVMTTGETIMCDRYGCVTLPDLKTLDFSRRNFLKATGLTTLTMAVGPGLLGQALAADTTVKGPHGPGFCNLNFFLAHALQ